MMVTTDLSAGASLLQLRLTAGLLAIALGQFAIGSDVMGRKLP